MLKIYGVPISVHTRKVIVAAIAKGIEHEIVPVVPVIPDNPPHNWRALSPTGKIPAISHIAADATAGGEFHLADSAAICAYLERIQPSPPLYPADAREYATALALEQFAGNMFREVVHPLFHETFVAPKIRAVPTNLQHVDDVLARAVPENFGYLDAQLRGDWLTGRSMTVADIAVASNLVTYQYIGFDLYRARFPRLAAHFDRVVRHPAVREALIREAPVVDSMNLDRAWHVQDR